MKRFRAEFLILSLFLLIVLIQGIFFLSGKKDPGNVPGSGFAESIGKGDAPAALNVVDLNTATDRELCMIPGIGPVMAERIITYREENGPFTSVEDILLVSGIGEKTYSNIVDFITVR